MMAEKKKGLGMGLSALLGADEAEYGELERGEPTKTVAIIRLHPGKYQPRHGFAEEALEELAGSIREKGVLQPLLVRPHPDRVGDFEIIAGERRWRAAQRAQLHELPVIVRDFNDLETLEVALIENLQRQDLSPLEEAVGYQRLMDEFSHTQEALAKALGKSRSHVANMLRLLGLPDSVKDMLDDGRLSAGHARALLAAADPLAAAKEVLKKGLNVRQTEALVKGGAGSTSAKAKAGPQPKDANIQALERDLANATGLKVDVRDLGGRGQVAFHYDSLDQLQTLIDKLTG